MKKLNKAKYRNVAYINFNTVFEIMILDEKYQDMKVKDWHELKDRFELFRINKEFPLEKFFIEEFQKILPEGVIVTTPNADSE